MTRIRIATLLMGVRRWSGQDSTLASVLGGGVWSLGTVWEQRMPRSAPTAASRCGESAGSTAVPSHSKGAFKCSRRPSQPCRSASRLHEVQAGADGWASRTSAQPGMAIDRNASTFDPGRLSCGTLRSMSRQGRPSDLHSGQVEHSMRMARRWPCSAPEKLRMGEYRPEAYWSRVAQEIDKRESRCVAGDDNPYYRYKRLRFLRKFLDTIDFQSQVVLEVGIGPGGNLQHIATHHRPRKLLGADVSQKMLAIASSNLSPHHAVALTKIDGIALPYPDQSVDTSFTVTVLQHNTDEHMCSSLVHELCRVTKTTIVTIEDIGTNRALGGRGA